jgi:serine/threonine protein kinase
VRNEIRALEALSADDGCDAIIGFRGSFETKEKLCIVMDRAHGELAEIIAMGKVTVNESDAQEILKRVLEGVAFMHEHGFVHRDIKVMLVLLSRKLSYFVCPRP